MRGLISADWHLRADRPRCRIDTNWMETQRKAIAEVAEIAINKDTHLFILGDIFDTPRVAPEIISMFIAGIKDINQSIFILAGNHDLPYHSWNNVGQSSFGVLWNIALTDRDSLLSLPDYYHGAHFGELISNPSYPKSTDCLFLHRLVFPSEASKPPAVNAITAQDLLDEYPEYKWIFVGDYHSSYHYEKAGRHVINPGCLTRQRADLITYQPEVAYVDTESGTVEWIEIDDPAMLVTDAYLKKEQERNSRIEAFVESVKKSGQVSLSFMDNLNERIQENHQEIGEDALDIIQEITEEMEAGK